jgi:hypothetical protein
LKYNHRMPLAACRPRVISFFTSVNPPPLLPSPIPLTRCPHHPNAPPLATPPAPPPQHAPYLFGRGRGFVCYVVYFGVPLGEVSAKIL